MMFGSYHGSSRPARKEWRRPNPEDAGRHGVIPCHPGPDTDELGRSLRPRPDRAGGARYALARLWPQAAARADGGRGHAGWLGRQEAQLTFQHLAVCFAPCHGSPHLIHVFATVTSADVRSTALDGSDTSFELGRARLLWGTDYDPTDRPRTRACEGGWQATIFQVSTSISCRHAEQAATSPICLRHRPRR